MTIHRVVPWVRGAAWGSAAGIAAVGLVCAIGPREAWWFGVVYDLAQTLIVPAVALVLAALVARSGREAVALLAAVATLWAATSPARSPEPTGAEVRADAHRRLRVMTYNVWLRSGALDRSIALIEELAPDLVAVQEVGSRATERFAAIEHYPHQVMHWRDDRGDGDGLMSRFPILSSKGYDLATDRGRMSEYVVDVDGVPVLVVNMHLSRPPLSPVDFAGWASNRDLRLEQVALIEERTRVHDGPVLVLGDMNSPLGGAVYRRMVQEYGFRDALDDGPRSDTFPRGRFFVPAPLFVLDYVFARGAIEVVEGWVPQGGGSDHAPVVADLRLAVPPHPPAGP